MIGTVMFKDRVLLRVVYPQTIMAFIIVTFVIASITILFNVIIIIVA